MGFGMTTVLLNLHNAGLIGLYSMILGMGLCYGGLAQVIAGIMEWKKQNTFGTLAFTSYGLFWISLVVMLVRPKMGWAAAPDKTSVGAYLLVRGCFTFLMFFGTLRSSLALITVFGSPTYVYFSLLIERPAGGLLSHRLLSLSSLTVAQQKLAFGLDPLVDSMETPPRHGGNIRLRQVVPETPGRKGENDVSFVVQESHARPCRCRARARLQQLQEDRPGGRMPAQHRLQLAAFLFFRQVPRGLQGNARLSIGAELRGDGLGWGVPAARRG
jgi:hypothetical protein